MKAPNLFILYVDDPVRSGAFYKKILRTEPEIENPEYVSFTLDGEFGLALWAKRKVAPPSQAAGINAEIAFSAFDRKELDDIYRLWVADGATVIQEPAAMDFGYTFAVADPDGNRLRVFVPPAK